MSDIMDEFEFKPLSEGLGFHGKGKAVNGSASPVKRSSEILSESGRGLGGLQSPLPRSKENRKSREEIPSTAVDDILKTLNAKKRPEFTEDRDILKQREKVKYVHARWEVSAFVLDLMLVLSLNLTCLILLLITTKVDLFANLFNPDSANMIYWSLAGLFASMTWIYMVSTRLFLGATPGEWVFDQRLGFPEEVGSAMYSLLILIRPTFVIATGFVFFPVLSLLLGRDILGRIMGLELVKKN